MTAYQSEHEIMVNLVRQWDGEVPASPDATTLLNIIQRMAARLDELEHWAGKLAPPDLEPVWPRVVAE